MLYYRRLIDDALSLKKSLRVRQRAPDGRGALMARVRSEFRFLRRADLVQYPVGLGCDTGIFLSIPTGKLEILDRLALISLLRVNFAESKLRKRRRRVEFERLVVVG